MTGHAPTRPETADRGPLGVLADFTNHDDVKVAVHDSNSAEIDAVWVALHGGNLNPLGKKLGRAHLDAEQAAVLRDALTEALADTDSPKPDLVYAEFVDTYGSTVTLQRITLGDLLELRIKGDSRTGLGEGAAFFQPVQAAQLRGGLTAWLDKQKGNRR